ncbi:MAG: metal-sulfur cluster assembly factor [Burkholderiales bacterium]
MDEDALLDALRAVDDPEAGMNIVELGLVYGVEAALPVARVRMTMTSPACPLGDYLTDAVRDALLARFAEITQVEIEMVWDPPWTPERMSEEARNFFGWK